MDIQEFALQLARRGLTPSEIRARVRAEADAAADAACNWAERYDRRERERAEQEESP